MNFIMYVWKEVIAGKSKVMVFERRELWVSDFNTP